jgi:hypothetical protein
MVSDVMAPNERLVRARNPLPDLDLALGVHIAFEVVGCLFQRARVDIA